MFLGVSKANELQARLDEEVRRLTAQSDEPHQEQVQAVQEFMMSGLYAEVPGADVGPIHVDPSLWARSPSLRN